MDFKGCFINGHWVETKDRLPVLSPWSGEVVGEVSLAGPKEWDAAMAPAHQAAGVRARQEELAQTIVAEGGKPLTYARGEMGRGLMALSLAAEEAERLGGEVLPLATIKVYHIDKIG